jgi:tetratricopeptide (TPR) repeat protein
VEFLVERFGHDSLCKILQDLAKDVGMHEALERHTQQTLDEFERGFGEFATDRARNLAPAAELDRADLPKPASNGSNQTARWLNDHPNNLWGTLQLAAQLIGEKRFEQAKEPLRHALELYPGYAGPDNAYVRLAAVHRELNETEEEAQVLRRFLEIDADDVPALLRLLELDAASEDWAGVATVAERLLGTHPLLAQPHRMLARAAEQLDRRPDAIAAYRRLLLLDPEDPADVHFRLARQLHAAGDATAKRHVLMALEEAPRFADALRLLLAIERSEQPTQN